MLLVSPPGESERVAFAANPPLLDSISGDSDCSVRVFGTIPYRTAFPRPWVLFRIESPSTWDEHLITVIEEPVNPTFGGRSPKRVPPRLGIAPLIPVGAQSPAFLLRRWLKLLEVGINLSGLS